MATWPQWVRCSIGRSNFENLIWRARRIRLSGGDGWRLDFAWGPRSGLLINRVARPQEISNKSDVRAKCLLSGGSMNR